MQKQQTKLERWSYLIGWHLMEWVLNISILILAWNYLCADFFGMDRMTIPNAIGIIIIKNVLINKQEKQKEPDIQFYPN